MAEAYVEQRQRLEYPMLPDEAESDRCCLRSLTPPRTPAHRQPLAADLLLEIGVEELPPHDLRDAIAQLQTAVPAALTAARLSFDGVDDQRHAATHRRLRAESGRRSRPPTPRNSAAPPPIALSTATAIPPKPPRDSPAAKGMTVADLEIREEGGKRYVYAVKQVVGQPSHLLLPDLLQSWVAGLRFGKSMRWNASNVSFSRPLRWLLALYGDQVVPFSHADVVSGNVSRGLRPHGSPALPIANAAAYFAAIAAAGIVVDRPERQRQIVAGLQETAATVGGHVPEDAALLDEVTDLVEQPLPLLGRFDPAFLELPAPVLITVMKKHQRYFPVLDESGAMLPYFITIANGADRDPELVTRGNEAVIRARYADAAYFVREDRKRPLEDFNADWQTLTFQEQLGSMLDKVQPPGTTDAAGGRACWV